MDILSVISSTTILLPLTMAAVNYKRLDNKGEKLFALQMGAWLLAEFVLNFWTYFKLGHNTFISNITYLEEGVLLSMAMLQWIKDGNNIKKASYYLILLYILVWGVLIYQNGIYEFNQKIIYAENTLLSVLSGYLLINLVSHVEGSLLYRFEFWACAGIFLFYVATIEIETLMIFLQFNAAKPYTWLHAIVNIFCNCLYAVAFLCKLKPQQVKWSM